MALWLSKYIMQYNEYNIYYCRFFFNDIDSDAECMILQDVKRQDM